MLLFSMIILHPFKQVSLNNTQFTRKQLRLLAKTNGVRRGRNTQDTIANLKAAGIKI
jgi:hypothetical protein